MRQSDNTAGAGHVSAQCEPPPEPPEKPLPFDCCESGCDRCVFDVYAEEMEHYQAALAQWRRHNPGCDAQER